MMTLAPVLVLRNMLPRGFVFEDAGDDDDLDVPDFLK